MIYFWFLCGIYGILCCTSFWSQFKQTVRGTYVISRCGSKNRQSVAGGRRRRGAASAECPHPQCALPRKAFCIFAATCINVDKKLLPLQVPQCCWLLAAWCCLLLPAVKTATSLCGKHLIVAHLCPEFGRATRVATATETVFVFEFSFAISICNWQKAERSRGKACGIVNALRCLPLVVASRWGWQGWRLYLSSAITIIISNNQRVVVATATECQMLRNACNITADCCGQSASHCCGAWGNNYN